jgi:hypothetical protein
LCVPLKTSFNRRSVFFPGIKGSVAIKGYLAKHEYEMPKSRTRITKSINEFFVEKRDALKAKIQISISSGAKFSITTDEWTDVALRRYLNVTLHGESSHKLGLVQIIGSCNAEMTLTLVEKKLDEFGIKLSDIIASTQDGAAVMKKYGSLTGAFSQFCYNHGVHLAVTDIFYKKDKKTTSDSSEAFKSDDEEYEMDESMEEFIEIESDDADADSIADTDEELEDSDFSDNIAETMHKSRKLVKFFRLSTVRDPILQKFVVEQEKKELRLILDVRTRWNSIVPMIQRLLLLKNCIRKALIAVGNLSLFDEKLFSDLENILQVLKPAELAVLELSKANATLVTTEGVFRFLFKTLDDQGTSLSKKFSAALKTRILERRNKELVSLMVYLQNPRSVTENAHQELNYSTRATIISTAKQIIQTKFAEPETTTEQDDITINETSVSLDDSMNDMAAEMAKSLSAITSDPTDTSKNTLQQEFRLWETTGTRSLKLEKLNECLKTIQPTSTESERVFSVAGSFSTKIRNRMKFELLNTLVFLKYYFLENKNK